MNVEPYSDDEIADARTHLSCDDESDRCHYHDVAHWLATVDALRARLAAAEAEAERAAVLLRKARRLLHEPSMFGREKLDACVEHIDAHLASRPEGEVRDGR